VLQVRCNHPSYLSPTICHPLCFVQACQAPASLVCINQTTARGRLASELRLEVPACLVNETLGAPELHAGLTTASRPSLHDQATLKVTNEAEPCLPVQVVRHWAALSLGGSHAAGVSTDAECYTWGCNDLGQLGYSAGENKHVPTKMDILRGWDVKAIACGCVPMIPCETFRTGSGYSEVVADAINIYDASSVDITGNCVPNAALYGRSPCINVTGHACC
jgi:hypothetical protein